MKTKRLQQRRRPPSIGRRILLFVLIVVCITSIASTTVSAEEYQRGNVYSASQYQYADDIYLGYPGTPQTNYNLNIENNTHLLSLGSYRYTLIWQYNNDVIELVSDFNRLDRSQQTVYLTEFDRVTRNLIHYETGVFKRVYDFLIDTNDPHNEYDCRAYREELTDAYNAFSEFKQKIHEFVASIGDVQSDEIIGETLSMLEMMWLSLGVWLSGAAGATTGTSSVVTSVFSMFNAETIVNTYLPMFQTAAYLVFFIAFATGIMDSAVRFDISDPKVIIKLLCRVIIAKVLIDLSSLICFFIFNYINGFASAIIGQANQLTLISPAATSDNYSSIPVIGWLVSFLQSLADLIPVLIVSVITFFCVLRAMVKLLTRSFEMISLTCLSSVFFACFAGETTKKYGERFLISFISVAGSLIFMAIGYAVGGDIIIQMSQGTSNVGLIYQLVVVWAICKFITNPPKVLSQLVAA